MARLESASSAAGIGVFRICAISSSRSLSAASVTSVRTDVDAVQSPRKFVAEMPLPMP